MTTDATENQDKKTDTFDFIVNRAKELYSGIGATGPGIQSGDLSRQARKEWEEECERQKTEEDIIERYCYDIRGIKPTYEYGFEEYLHLTSQHQYQLSNQTDKMLELERWGPGYEKRKPEGMTNKEWAIKKRQKKLEVKEEIQLRKSNKELESKSPFHMLLKRIEKIGCHCNAEDMRQNTYCNTCDLLVRVNGYLEDIFRIASMLSKENSSGIGDE